jgi:alpha-ketoglutarate-dependent 2,4-dichlorophenoxyacetate dioxygenase
MEINQLHPRFVGEITGLDTSGPVTPATVDFFEAAMAKYAVCVIRNASLNDADHIRFARAFGPLELAPPNKRISPELYDIGNLLPDGEIVPPKPDGAQPADFELFHTDSPFNSLPTKWSLLLAYVTPPEGADTLYIDTRAVYEDLPQDLKDQVDRLSADHDLFRALQRNGVEFDDAAMKRDYPRMAHPLVRLSASGRKALYMGWHAIQIVGWTEEESRELLERLYAFATQDKYIYTHKWRPGDMVVWDNRCTMHSATSFERYRYKRDMRRATINEFGPEVSALESARTAE